MSSASPWHWPDIDFDPIPDLEINSLPDGFELQILDRLCFPDPHVLVQTDHSPQPLHTKTKDQHQYSVLQRYFPRCWHARFVWSFQQDELLTRAGLSVTCLGLGRFSVFAVLWVQQSSLPISGVDQTVIKVVIKLVSVRSVSFHKASGHFVSCQRHPGIRSIRVFQSVQKGSF